jgi:hypothetical protein
VFESICKITQLKVKRIATTNSRRDYRNKKKRRQKNALRPMSKEELERALLEVWLGCFNFSRATFYHFFVLFLFFRILFSRSYKFDLKKQQFAQKNTLLQPLEFVSKKSSNPFCGKVVYTELTGPGAAATRLFKFTDNDLCRYIS